MTDLDGSGQAVEPSPRLQEPDAHGQAALLLVESLIHGLVTKSLISTLEAIDVVESAIEVKREVASDWGDSQQTLERSITLLEALSGSLALDLPS